MIDYAGFCQIQHLHAAAGTERAAQIAATLSRDPRTVAYWLTQEASGPGKRVTCRVNSSVKAQMVRMLERYPSSRGPGFSKRLGEQGF